MTGVRQAVARVLGPTGEPVGGAFLVAPDLLLTAAHVVNLAVGRGKAATERPTGEIRLSFVTDPRRVVRAELATWVPPGGAAPEDIAGLRLVEPAPSDAALAPLAELADPQGSRVLTFGFPRDAPNGGWGFGVLAGVDARGLVQLDTLRDSQFTIEEGFSGTPVWDQDTAAVAGMVLEGWTRVRRSGFIIPTTLLLAGWPELGDLVRPASPFRGLRPFGEQDANVFFGRDELIAEVVARSEHSPAVVLVGASGNGKSSVLHAGVLPRLRQDARTVIATLRPSQARTPMRAIAQALVRTAEPGTDPLARATLVDEVAQRLARGEVAEVVGNVLDRRRGERLVLVVDQLEEALLATPDELAQFAAVLEHCVGRSSRLTLLAAVRQDFLGQAYERKGLGKVMQAGRVVPVDPMTRAELRAAIVEPVRRTNMVSYEPGLVDDLLKDVGGAAGRLPLLQFTLAMLWDEQKSGLLTQSAYKAMGGVESALARHADAVWNGLSDSERTAAGRLLVQLLYPLGEPPGFVRRAARRDQLDDEQWQAAQRLAADRTRLVVVREQESGGIVELAHDALVTHWRRLVRLGEQDRTFREWQEGLRQRLRRGSPPPEGADLAEALRWLAERGADVPTAERSYVELGRRNRAKQRRKWAVVGVVVLLVAGLIFVLREGRVAGDAADNLIHSRDLRDPYAKLRTTLRAYETSATDLTKPAVAAEYDHYADVDRLVPDFTARPILVPGRDPVPVEPPSALVQKVSTDGRTLVTTDPQDNVTIWRIEGATVTGRALGEPAIRVTVSRDGRYVAYLAKPNIWVGPNAGPFGSCQDVCLLDTTTGRTRQLGKVDAGLLTPVIRFDPTGRLLGVVYSADAATQRLATWDVATGHRHDDVTLYAGEIDQVHDMWLTADGRRVVLDLTMPKYPGARELDSALASVELGGPKPAASLLTDPIDSSQVAVSADGTRLAVLVPTGLVVLDLATLDKVAGFPGLQSTGSISLDPHGDKVFVIDTPTVSSWSVADPSAPPTVVHSSSTWLTVLPLGSGADAPVLLAYEDVIGLALPDPGRPAPMRRIAGEPPDASYDDEYDKLIAALASGVPMPSELTNLPAGAYDGTIGG